MSVDDQDTPAVGEEIHLPGPTLIPLLSAISITMIVIGTTIQWGITIVGVILFLITTIIWVRDTRRDIDDLPEEHH